MARRKKRTQEPLDYHEGLSDNQVRIILRELDLATKYNDFNNWMYGQTRPIICRDNHMGRKKETVGIYEYDLFRWISSQKTGVAPIWD